MVELRGFEPWILPAEMGSDLLRMFADVVTSAPCVLRICVVVLHDVTMLAATHLRNVDGTIGRVAEVSTDGVSYNVGAARMSRQTSQHDVLRARALTRQHRYRGGLLLVHSLNGFRLHQMAMYLKSQT
jgi:hypothetical protein